MVGCSSFYLFMTTFKAVAITPDGEMIPFGPKFATEDDAWKWLHFECDCAPVHKSIDVFQIWNE